MNEIIHAVREEINVSDPALHRHDGWEFCLCLEGDGRILFGDMSLPVTTGSIVITPPDTPHAPAGEGEFLTLHIQQTAYAFQQPYLAQDDENQSIRRTMEDALWHFSRTGESRAALLIAYGQLLVQHVSVRRPAAPQSQLVEEIARSIRQNLANPLYALDETLRSAPYCYDYLCRLFRQELHTTPHKYLTELRLQSAADALLISPGSSMSEIARMCGYSDPLYFSRMFKKRFGVSPREYVKSR